MKLLLVRYRFSSLRDPKTGKLVRIENPRSKWLFTYREDWVLVPKQTWTQAQRRLAELSRASTLTGRKWTKPERHPKDLFDGLLFCSCCGKLITRSRSGKNPQYASVNGQSGAHQCQLSKSKNVRLVRDSLLGYVNSHILCEEMAQFVVDTANERLGDEARRQCPDPKPIRSRIAERKARMANWADAIGDTTSTQLRGDLEQRYQQEAEQVVQDNRELEMVLAKRESDPVRLSLGAARRAFANLSDILGQDVSRAAHMLRGLLGPIAIHQEPSEWNPDGFRWVATFTPRWADTIALLVPAKIVARINAVVGGMGTPARVIIEQIPLYQSLAPQIAELRSQGLTKTQISRRINKSTTVVKDALTFIDHGTIQTPRSQQPPRHPKPRRSDVTYKAIASDVLRMRDEQQLSFPRIPHPNNERPRFHVHRLGRSIEVRR